LVKIRTHYEMMFRAKGVPIKLISYRPWKTNAISKTSSTWCFR
jgi:hypothetical protein